jgi:septal ring factor EnvC (AmiA/AmiB activator)
MVNGPRDKIEFCLKNRQSTLDDRQSTMADRRSTIDYRLFTIGIVLAFLAVAFPSAQTTDRSRTEAQARRATERLQSLQREAADLAAEERSLLTDLRRLEVERDLKTEQLKHLDADAARVARALGNSGNQIDELEAREAESRPILEARMIQLYKLGSAGYMRMLFNVADLKEFGRAYRMVSALAAVDRQRAAEHQKTLAQLRAAHTLLVRRRNEMAKLRQEAQSARAAAERAATARAQLIAEIDRRRDLTAELANELQAAQRKLQDTLGAFDTGAPRAAADGPALPIRPFRGDLEWPAVGRVMSRFGRADANLSVTTAQSGIQIAIAEGTPVRAVHDGTVVFAGPFTGYGNLVIIDHGEHPDRSTRAGQVYSLYGHLGTIQAERGTKIDRGEALGLAGRVLSGFPGIYFEMRVDGKPVDPLEWLKKKP